MKYKIGSNVPGNWYPHLPVHIDNQSRNTQLRRALLYQGGDTEETLYDARSHLLRFAGENHHVNEEAVTRAAARIRLTAHRSRWINGEIYTLYGLKTGPGEGEGSSGLHFDFTNDS
jgi:hypothetical protein